MILKKRICNAIVLTIVLFTTVHNISVAEAYMKVNGIPEDLTFPVPAGKNIILTASITGGVANNVWLAKTEESRDRLFLIPVEEGLYQINLADTAIMKIVKDNPDDTRFHIFAKIIDGNVLASIPILYYVEYRTHPEKILIKQKNKERVISPIRYIDNEEWLYPDEVISITAYYSDTDIFYPLVATCGEKQWNFENIPDTPNLLLKVTEEMKKEWRSSALLKIEYRKDDRLGTCWILKKTPDQLDFSASALYVKAKPDSRETIPGSGEYLWLNTSHIYGDEVHVQIGRWDDTIPLARLSLRERECANFEYRGKKYNLFLQNIRFGNIFQSEYLNFWISPVPCEEIKKIDLLLRLLRLSDATFIFEDQIDEEKAKDAVPRLESAFTTKGPVVTGAMEFIDQIASRSPRTGKDYMLKTSDGKLIKAREWFLQKLNTLEK